MVFGFIKGFQPIAGYSYGAKNYNRLHESIKTSVLWTTIFCVIVGLILFFFSENIISQFTKGDNELIEIGCKSLRINGILYVQPIADVLSAIITSFMSLSLHKNLNKEQSNNNNQIINDQPSTSVR